MKSKKSKFKWRLTLFLGNTQKEYLFEEEPIVDKNLNRGGFSFFLSPHDENDYTRIYFNGDFIIEPI